MRLHGYSDRIHHALAFTAKHYPERVSRYDDRNCLIRASSVAVILARYSADECSIVASILKQLVDACSLTQQATLGQDIAAKFGGLVAATVAAAAEPRYDVLGRERTWKACRFEFLSRLTEAPARAVEVCVAHEMHLVGSALVDIRRLGVEYVESLGEASAESTIWWHRALLDTLGSHPHWRREAMLEELRLLAGDLARRLEDLERELG